MSVHSHRSQGSDAALDDGVHAMEEVIAVCINKVCRRRKFGLGNIWVVQDARLVCAPTYQTVATESEKLQFFGDRCREITFALGEGLPGRTWRTQEAAWERNVQVCMLRETERQRERDRERQRDRETEMTWRTQEAAWERNVQVYPFGPRFLPFAFRDTSHHISSYLISSHLISSHLISSHLISSMLSTVGNTSHRMSSLQELALADYPRVI